MKRAWLFVACVCISCFAAAAHADTYERQRTERLLKALQLEPAALPEGKRIAWVKVVRDEVFVADELWPHWFNWFHVTSKEAIVRRELLFAEGEGYREQRVEETMRNLRTMSIFALVRIVPVALEGTNDVGVLVHTRDLWSLRVETGFTFTKFADRFVLRGTERNLFGRNKTLWADLDIVPQSYTLAQGYYARRVWGSDVSLTERAGIIINRSSERPEGSTWLLNVGEPFYNLKQRFSYRAYLSYDDYIARSLKKGKVRTVQAPNVGPELPDPRLAWRQKSLLANLIASVRHGETTKQTYMFGWDARSNVADPVAETNLAPELEKPFREQVLPFQRTQIGPTLEYDLWTARYVTFENLSTYGQSENVRVGPSFNLTTRLPLSAFGSNTNSWVVAASAGFTHAVRDFLGELSLVGRARLEAEKLVDQRLDVVLRGATPILFRAFRLVARVGLEARRNDLANTYVSLGASNGLRGYDSQTIGANGASRFLTNLELRTLPIEWQALHLGAVAFYDVGSVYNALSDARLYHAVGIGLRVLFPQFNRYPFSIDAGTSWDPGFRIVPTVTSGQVVPMTSAEDPES